MGLRVISLAGSGGEAELHPGRLPPAVLPQLGPASPRQDGGINSLSTKHHKILAKNKKWGKKFRNGQK